MIPGVVSGRKSAARTRRARRDGFRVRGSARRARPTTAGGGGQEEAASRPPPSPVRPRSVSTRRGRRRWTRPASSPPASRFRSASTIFRTSRMSAPPGADPAPTRLSAPPSAPSLGPARPPTRESQVMQNSQLNRFFYIHDMKDLKITYTNNYLQLVKFHFLFHHFEKIIIF